MGDLVVIASPTEAKATKVHQKLLAMQKEYFIELGDADCGMSDVWHVGYADRPDFPDPDGRGHCDADATGSGVRVIASDRPVVAKVADADSG